MQPDFSPGLRLGWLLLGLAVLLIYAQVVGHEFTNYDDPAYITNNLQVTNGFTLSGAQQAFENDVLGMWHPLTVLSHMLDWQMFGGWAGGHIVVNVALHALNAGCLFLLLRLATGAGWPSFAVALLFAVHPINVESVAWASQRKTTLSTLFFLLTLLSWRRYVVGRARVAYVLSVACYALGLMCKPILVSLPGVLLLLDFWPLDRIRRTRHDVAKVLVEKLPFLVLSLATVAILLIPRSTSAVSFEPSFTGERWLRALANMVQYLRRLVWPTDLAVLYPERPVVSAGELVIAIIVLAGATLVAWRRRWPSWVGWLWFLGTIFPVSGIMSIGPHEQADRYAYIPSIGIFILIAWAVPKRFWTELRWSGAVVASVGLVFASVAWVQARSWRNSLTLWTHQAELYPPSLVQQMNYGNALSAAGRATEAERCFEVVARLRPGDPQAFINLAIIRNQRGEKAKAIDLLQRALRADPAHAGAHDLFGSILHATGRVAEAKSHLEFAIRLDPKLGSAYVNLGVLLAQQGDLAGAERLFLSATSIRSVELIAWQNLAIVRAQRAGVKERVQ